MTAPQNKGASSPVKASSDDYPQDTGLFVGFEAYQTPTDADYRRLLTDGIVVPDANVFLNLYRYNEQTRDDLFSVLRGLGDHLWVPHQVVAEFWRNRETVLQDPRTTSLTIGELEGHRDKAINTLRSWANRVSLRQARRDELIATLTSAFARVTDGVSELADNDAAEFARNTNRDPVLLELDPILRGRTGTMPSKEEYEAALAEAKRRTELKIPPGYKDAGKDPISAAGDYLVWSQTVQYAKARKRDVLFVTADIKEDWWRRERGEPRGPHPELVQELRDQADVRLFMLRPEILLVQAREALKINVSDESVQDIERVDQLASLYETPTNASGIIERWAEILDSVKENRKVAWILLEKAIVSDFDGESLTLKFKNDGYARGFQTSGYALDFQNALDEVFGIRPKVLVASLAGSTFGEAAIPMPAGKVRAEGAVSNNRVTSVAPGDKVYHDSYGIGQVLSCEGLPDDPEARIDFGGQIGVKHLVLRYAPLRGLQSENDAT